MIAYSFEYNATIFLLERVVSGVSVKEFPGPVFVHSFSITAISST
jgi:hypothetical protein